MNRRGWGWGGQSTKTVSIFWTARLHYYHCGSDISDTWAHVSLDTAPAGAVFMSGPRTKVGTRLCSRFKLTFRVRGSHPTVSLTCPPPSMVNKWAVGRGRSTTMNQQPAGLLLFLFSVHWILILKKHRQDFTALTSADECVCGQCVMLDVNIKQGMSMCVCVFVERECLINSYTQSHTVCWFWNIHVCNTHKNVMTWSVQMIKGKESVAIAAYWLKVKGQRPVFLPWIEQ